MKILAHRGYWKVNNNPNTLEAFRDAFYRGWGIETDVRGYCGKLVISHGLPNDSCPLFADVLNIRDNWEKASKLRLPIAINIKADGLKNMLLSFKKRIAEDFVFDMSVPELIAYKDCGISFFTRQSDVEPIPVCLGAAAGVWMDGFYHDWIDAAAVKKMLKDVAQAGIISPEIHKRPHDALWQSLSTIKDCNFLLCTDAPDEAERYFASGGGKTND